MVDYAKNYSQILVPFTQLNGFFAYERTPLAEKYLLWVVALFFGFMMLGNVNYGALFLRLRSSKFKQTQSKTSHRLQVSAASERP